MALTHNEYFNTPAMRIKVNTINTSKTTKATLWLTSLSSFMLITLLVIVAFAPTTTHASTAADQYDLDQYLNTQTVLIDTLRLYIETLEQKIGTIKRKTSQIKLINDAALTDVPKYVNNPLNALTILKRLTSDWEILHQYALNVNSTNDIVENLTNTRKSLKFPSESDFDEAASNLLRIQDVYQLEPERLAVGEVNGVKLGSAMSWSDCLEIGRKCVQNGDFIIGKFWMEVAFGKLPFKESSTFKLSMKNVTEDVLRAGDGGRGELEKAYSEIMEALIETEFSMGNLNTALDMINEMLQKQPKSKTLRKTKNQIEKELEKSAVKFDKRQKNKNKRRKQSNKSAEESLIEEICRMTTNIGASGTPNNNNNKENNYNNEDGGGNYYNSISQTHCCRLLDGNLPQLLLQPLKVELLNIDPYIVIYHNVLRANEINYLHKLIDEENNVDDLTVGESLVFTRLAQKKLMNIAERLQIITGHASANFDEWKVDRWTYEDSEAYTEPLVSQTTKMIANVLFNLQTAKLGGTIVFPQLEFGLSLPQHALLYWTQLDEHHEYDYRTKQHVCPAIVGTQLMAYTSIRA